ncbi:MAG: hypothetical protein ABL934_05135 [Lysobacteraceae bacterium]
MNERSSMSKLCSANMLLRGGHDDRGNGSARAAGSARDLIVLAERLG